MKSPSSTQKHLIAFDIPFFGLKKGTHHYEYAIEDEFFTHFEDPLLTQANITVQLDFHKNKDNLFVMDIAFQGTIGLTCDRCLAPIDYPVSDQHEIAMKVGNVPTFATDDDLDIVYLSPDMTSYNVAELLYEFIVLHIPMQSSIPLDPLGNRLCPKNSEGKMPCNEDVLQALQRTNQEAIDAEDQDIDPRWLQLQKLKKS
ncbi:MAG: DUF177 domain-containing protein [Chitinophagales bacterium]|jgi:uncharacterized metal-binding protein YceD (DUF177 family)|nr:DUF177 domain-containing protein [Chitinophagales bacterium]